MQDAVPVTDGAIPHGHHMLEGDTPGVETMTLIIRGKDQRGGRVQIAQSGDFELSNAKIKPSIRVGRDWIPRDATVSYSEAPRLRLLGTARSL